VAHQHLACPQLTWTSQPHISSAHTSLTLEALRSTPGLTDDIHMFFLRHNLRTDPDLSACHDVSSLPSLAISGRIRQTMRYHASRLKEQVTCIVCMAYSTRISYPRLPSSLTAETPLTHFHIPVDTLHTYSPSTCTVQYNLPMAC